MTETDLKAVPRFPEFKAITLTDRNLIQKRIDQYEPETSEWTFTNLFIWREYYRYQWTLYNDFLIILANPLGWGYYFLQPIGTGNRLQVTRDILMWVKEEKEEYEPRIERADTRFITEIGESELFTTESVRDQYDYVYLCKDLSELKGRKYHSKKNHVNRFYKNYSFEYREMTEHLSQSCVQVLKKWCNWRECDKNLIMRAEFEAVYESLIHFAVLEIQGGVILVNEKVVAFTLGEQLNRETGVVHVEKADPKIPEAFSVINQQFSERQWSRLPYLNREQDLGEPGLRKAKKSYHPHHMVEKFRVRFSQSDF